MHRIAVIQARNHFEYARANNIVVSEAVLRGELLLDEWHRAHWLEIVAEAVCVAAKPGFGHYTR